MNKAELIEALAVHFGGNKAEAQRALKAVLDTIIENTAKGERVTITGFGVFEKIHRPARIVRNPRTGERKQAEAMDIPRFRPGSELKDVVAGVRKLGEPPVGSTKRKPSSEPVKKAAKKGSKKGKKK